MATYILQMWIERALEPRLRHSAGDRTYRRTADGQDLHAAAAFSATRVRFARSATGSGAGRERAGFVPQPASSARHDRRGAVRAGAVSPSEGRDRCSSIAQRAVSPHGLAEVHPDEECLGVPGGRADILELETLSFAEIRAALPDAEVTSSILRGGFPELYANPDIDPVAFYNSYLASLRDFERFLRACALRSANLLNKADLARDVGISPSTANQWLSMLEASGQAVLLEPWFSNRTKPIVKSPKLYLADTGLLCALLNIRTLDDLLHDTMNMEFMRNSVGLPSVVGGGVISRTPNGFPFSNGFRATPVSDLA
jgi:hypothetical protein